MPLQVKMQLGRGLWAFLYEKTSSLLAKPDIWLFGAVPVVLYHSLFQKLRFNTLQFWMTYKCLYIFSVLCLFGWSKVFYVMILAVGFAFVCKIHSIIIVVAIPHYSFIICYLSSCHVLLLHCLPDINKSFKQLMYWSKHWEIQGFACSTAAPFKPLFKRFGMVF